MTTPAENTGNGQREPVEVGDALDLPDDDVEAPTDPSEQPPLPDFNS